MFPAAALTDLLCQVRFKRITHEESMVTTGIVTRFGAVPKYLPLLLALILMGVSHLKGQQTSSPSISECKQLYNERRYMEARNCFSRILAEDQKNPVAREYYRLSNVLAVGTSKPGDPSHTKGTPETPTLEKLVQEALDKDHELRRIQQQTEATGLSGSVRLPVYSSLEFVRLGLPYFHVCPQHSSPSGDFSTDSELQKQLTSPESVWWQALSQTRKNELVAQVKKSYVNLVSVRQELRMHDAHLLRLLR